MQRAFCLHTHLPDRDGNRPDFLCIIQRNQNFFCFIEPPVGKHAIRPIKLLQRAMAQNGILLPQGNCCLMEGNQLHILPAPGIGAAVIGICPACYACFVPVIYGRRTVPCHLQQNSFPQHCFFHICIRRGTALCFHSADLAIGAREKAGMVMIGKLIHGNRNCL